MIVHNVCIFNSSHVSVCITLFQKNRHGFTVGSSDEEEDVTGKVTPATPWAGDCAAFRVTARTIMSRHMCVSKMSNAEMEKCRGPRVTVSRSELQLKLYCYCFVLRFWFI